MKSTALEGLFYWSVHQPDRGIDFNGFYWRPSRLLIDPMPLSNSELDWLSTQGGVDWILLTNAQHLRDAVSLRERLGARILAPDCDRSALRDIADEWFSGGSSLPGPLQKDVEVRWIRGGKTEAEAVLLLPTVGAMLFGDAVRSHVSGVLRLLPDEKIAERDRLIADVLALAEERFEAILLGDGDCLFAGGRAAFDALVRRLRDS